MKKKREGTMKRIKLTDGTKMTFDELAVMDPNGTPYVMTLLREKLLNPEDVPEELLYLKDKSGASALDLCIERFKEPVPYFRTPYPNVQYVQRIVELIDCINTPLPKYFKKIKRILIITNENNWSIAHSLAIRKDLPVEMMTEDILTLSDDNNCFVASLVAFRRQLPDWAKKRIDILKLSNSDKESLVAQILVNLNDFPSDMIIPEVLQLKNIRGLTVLHSFVKNKRLTKKMMMLPWSMDGKTLIYEHLQSEQFLKKASYEDCLYIKEKLIELATSLSLKELTNNVRKIDNIVGIER